MEDTNPPKKWPIAKILNILVLTVLIFAGGVAVGRGDIRLKGLSIQKTGTAATNLDYSSVDYVYNLLRSDFDGSLSNESLLDGLKTGLVSAAGDPYTVYFNPEDAKLFNEELSSTFTGIGAELGTDDNNNIVIVAPLAGYPAEKAGLKPKDIINTVDGELVSGMSIDKVVRKIRGPAGSQVKLIIQRAGQKPFDVTLTREQITIATVESSVEGGIGYLKVTQFSNDTTKLAKEAAASFKTKNAKAVILDLRNNPGGYLSGAVEISSLWLDKGQVVVDQRRDDRSLELQYATGGNSLKDLPTVVLVNEGSASASEITAGALRDSGLAIIVGEKSFGKGSVQQVKELPNGGELKVTFARWYTPKGANIDKQGITPDITVGLSEADQQAGRDPQKDRAVQILQSKINGQ